MKLRSTPLIDASFIFAISLPLIFVTIWVFQGFDAAANQLTVVAAIYLLPTYSLQAIAGLFIRDRNRLNKFTMSVALALIVAALVTWMTVQGFNLETQTDPNVVLALQQAWIFISMVFFTSQLLGSALTHFLLTKQK